MLQRYQVVLSALISLALCQDEYRFKVPWPAPSHTPLGVYYKAAVASDYGLCAEIGRNLLQKGGSAIDAIIGTNFCQGSMSPLSSGIGAGMYMTYYDRKTKKCTVVNGREAAPMDISKLTANNTRAGWKSIGVPGEISTMWQAHLRWGKLEWKQLIMPTVRILRDGFPVSGYMADASKASYVLPDMRDPANNLEIFYNNETDNLYQQGEIIRRPKLAATLERLANAKDPEELFYRGELAKEMVADIQAHGGVLTEEDFANYHARIEEDPVLMKIPQTDAVVCGPPPPSSAAVTAAILNILANVNVDGLDPYNPTNQGEALHKFIEAMKQAYAVRSKLGDRWFVEGVNETVAEITSEKWGNEKRLAMPFIAPPNATYLGGRFIKSDKGTTPMNCMDQDGNGVSVISTINWFFGSRRRSKDTGILWNNQLADFGFLGTVDGYGLAPSEANLIAPEKRPLSSMSPLVIYNDTTGDPILTIGAEGGSRIISAVAYTTMQVLYFGANIKEAIDAPRVHNQVTPYETVFEEGFPSMMTNYLRMVHKQIMKPSDDPEWDSSVVCGVHRHPDGKIYANSDRRKHGGWTAGY